MNEKYIEEINLLKNKNEFFENKINALNIDAAKLIENNKLRDKLLYILSHDVHSPLRFSTMVGKAILTKQNDLTKDEIIEALTDINEASSRMLLLISNVLKWIEFQKENYRPSFKKENLNQLVSDKLDFFSLIAKSKNINVINNIPNQLFIETDKTAFGIIIQNLINNAVKFTLEGEIEIGIFDDGKVSGIYISDTGMGMTTEQIKSIENNVEITPQADTENLKGNGLGWMLINELLINLNASFEIKSGNNIGTTVKIIIPFMNNDLK